MKTKELIRLLQEEDPSGELECCIGSEPILEVTNLPAYYDGRLGVLLHDEKGYRVGYEFRTKGRKVSIKELGWKSMIWDTDAKCLFTFDTDPPPYLLQRIEEEKERCRKFREKRQQLSIKDSAIVKKEGD